MATSWSGREPIASQFINVITGVNYDGSTVILANNQGEIILGFSDTGTPIPGTTRMSGRDSI